MYCKYDKNTKKCLEVGTGSNTDFYKSIGMTDEEVEQAYDGSYWLKGYAPTQPIEEVRQANLSELTAQALAFEENVNKDISFISSVGGYHINGDRRTRSNLEDLITYSTTDIIQFRDYDNTMREVTKEQLQVMLKEHVINGQNLYYQKWAFEKQIKSCTTIEELNAIEIKFTMHDFSKEGAVADE